MIEFSRKRVERQIDRARSVTIRVFRRIAHVNELHIFGGGRNWNDAFSNTNSPTDSAFERANQSSFRGADAVARAKTTAELTTPNHHEWSCFYPEGRRFRVGKSAGRVKNLTPFSVKTSLKKVIFLNPLGDKSTAPASRK